MSYRYLSNNKKGLACFLFLICLILVNVVELWLSSTSTKGSEEWFAHKLQHCPCERQIRTSSINQQTEYAETTCSEDAFARGPGQKVVAYSFFTKGTRNRRMDQGYLKGISDNLAAMPVYCMRLYFDVGTDDSLMEHLCSLACANPILDLCHAGHLPGTPFIDAREVFAMIWRFFPTIDPQVDVYNCRDLDSRFIDRELEAVNEWLEIGEAVHAMRDHPAHYVPMLGAAWGADLRRRDSRALWKASWIDILKDEKAWGNRSSYGNDQDVLKLHVWPWARNMSVQHDSYACRGYDNTIGFPTERRNEPNNFVTSGGFYNYALWTECPVECRRKGHPEWLHC